jgi:hypothetical protein
MAKEKALGKASKYTLSNQMSFQNNVIDPSLIELEAIPLKIGISLQTSFHQNDPTGSMACGILPV